MIQNSRIARFTKSFSLSVAVVVTSVGGVANASAQVVDGDAFGEPATHSILEVAEEVTQNTNKASRFSAGPLTKIEPSDSAYDAPAAPLPRMTSVKPLAPHNSASGGDSSGTFAGSNPSRESTHSHSSAPNHASKLQPSRGVNSLRDSALRPAPEALTEDQPQQLSSSSVGSFSSQPSPTSNKPSRFADSNTIVSHGANATASIYGQTSGPDQSEGETEDETEEPKYESAYLHDQRPQQPQRDTPVADLFGSPTNSRPLAPPVQHPKTPVVADDFQVNERDFIQQTAYLSPATRAQQPFQNSGVQQNNRQFVQQQTTQRSQPNQQFGQPPQGQQTRQRNLPRQNQSQNQQQSQYQQQSQTQTTDSTDSTAAKEAIAKFSFDANQQLAQGLPIRMIDVLQQSGGRASRSQLIPQYWEVYFDWAQSVSAKHHHDWVASINSAKQTDASSLEIAKSNAQNDITFSAIQLGKSQAKMKSLTGSAQPIVPMDSPTVTRVKTNYAAFKSRGMVAPKFEGIDSTLKQMHALIASRANTVTMAQQNANEAQQLYSRNQSTIDHVLSAGRTWRAAESDFIASVIEYNKAYADYALALPYGRGPLEAVVNMLIVKPTTNPSVRGQVANGRPNLSNGGRANTASQHNTSGNDYSVPYGSSQPNNRTAQSRQTNSNQLQRNPSNTSHANMPNRNGGNNAQSAFNAARSQTAAQNYGGQNFGGQNSAANSLIANTRQQTPPSGQPQRGTRFSNTAQPSAARTNQPSQSTARNMMNAIGGKQSTGTNRIQRPSQFPTGQPAASSPFSSATSQSQPPQQSNQRSFGDQRPQAQPQPPAGDKTAGLPSPFSPVRSADSSTATPATTPKPPASAGGFNFGG